jgi:hypothetical protein
MAAKVVEADAGVHTLAMSVAVCSPFSSPLFFFVIAVLLSDSSTTARNQLAVIRCFYSTDQ